MTKEQFIKDMSSCSEKAEIAFNSGVRAEYAGVIRGLVWAFTGRDPGVIYTLGDALKACEFECTTDANGKVTSIEGIPLR